MTAPGYKAVSLPNATVEKLEALRIRFGLRSVPKTVIKLADDALVKKR